MARDLSFYIRCFSLPASDAFLRHQGHTEGEWEVSWKLKFSCHAGGSSDVSGEQ